MAAGGPCRPRCEGFCIVAGMAEQKGLTAELLKPLGLLALGSSRRCPELGLGRLGCYSFPAGVSWAARERGAPSRKWPRSSAIPTASHSSPRPGPGQFSSPAINVLGHKAVLQVATHPQRAGAGALRKQTRSWGGHKEPAARGQPWAGTPLGLQHIAGHPEAWPVMPVHSDTRGPPLLQSVILPPSSQPPCSR